MEKTNEQQIIGLMAAELRRLAPTETPWRALTFTVAINYNGQVEPDVRLYEGLDKRHGFNGKTLAEIEKLQAEYDPEAIRLAKLIALENEANELREQIRRDAEEKGAK